MCVGSVSQDIFFPTDEGLVIETPEDITSKQKIAFELGGKYRVQDRYEAVGGVAANVSHGLTRLGRLAACYSKVGNDDRGRWVINQFRQAKVPTEFLFTDKKAQTDLSAIIVLIQNGERTIFHNRDANELLEIIDRKFAMTEWVFASALNGEWQENLKKLLRLKETYGFLLALNPGQHNIREEPNLIFEAVSQADVLLLNKDEAIELVLTKEQQISRERLDNELFLLETLRDSGAKIIGLTDGKRGAWSFDGDEYWYCPIYAAKQLVDSTGAGDAFGSGFLAALLAGKPIEDALRYGIANSASVVSTYGAIAGLLSKDEMENVIDGITPERLHKKK